MRHGHETHAREIHAHEVHAHEVHAREIHTHEMRARGEWLFSLPPSQFGLGLTI
jgi:hypothetical protein